MKNYYSNSIDYHNDLDRFEAREREERAETEYERGRDVMRQIIADENKPLCVCLEYIGDNGYCPVHGYPPIEPEGSDTSMKAQLNDAGYGSQGVF